MQNNIHHTIDILDISTKAKKYFNSLEFYEIIEDSIVVNLYNDKKINEAKENLWSFAVDYESGLFTKQDLKKFIKGLVSIRAKYLKENYPKHQMLFYTWYESISGNFYFSLISNSQQLPFSSNISKLESLDFLIEEYIRDPYKGKIPLSECTLIESNDNMLIEKFSEPEKTTLNVWSTIIP
jgi:hypothetical protein